MGRKGDRETTMGARFSQELVPRLLPLGAVSSRKMFGGYGVFQEGKMFGLITSDAGFFLKVSDSNRARFEQAGAVQHGKMPYFQVPETVLEDDAKLLEWAGTSVDVAHA